jgi:hypothetical protein
MHTAPLIVALATTLAGPSAEADSRAPGPQPALVAPEEPEPEAEVDAQQDTRVEVDREVVVEKRSKRSKKSKKQKVKVTARVMAGWEYENERPTAEQGGDEDSDQSFFLRQARVRVDAKINDRLRAVVSGDLADALDARESYVFIRTVHANLRVHDAFQIRAGFFKRPISRLELRDSQKIPFRDRGLANARILEERQWGDRSAGVRLWGKVRRARLRWYVAVMNPDTRGTGQLQLEGVDALGRLVYAPWDWLSLGINGGYKRTERADGTKTDVGAMGGDVRVRAKGFYLSAEAIAGQDHQLADHEDPFAVGVLGYASYDVDLPKKFVLQPVVFGEWVDADTRYTQSEAVRVVAGLNLLWSKYLRVLPQVELIRPMGPVGEGTPWVESETYYLMLSVHMR